MRDRGWLEAAVAMPASGAGEAYFLKDLFETAAAYEFHIAERQPFVDGNKQTALHAAMTFLIVNGVTLPAAASTALYHAMMQIVGPSAALTLTGLEATHYAGARRLLSLSARGAYYPGEMTSFGQPFGDARGAITTALPLWPFRRPTVGLQLVGRGLLGLPRDTGFLQVGGVAPGPLYLRADREGRTLVRPGTLPEAITFTEPLAGYENLALAVDRVLIGNAALRFPIIVDRGSASSLGILPSFFLRELVFELFGAGAWEMHARRQDLHGAVGGRLGLDLRLGFVPFSLVYQLARRLADDCAIVHLVSLRI